jgi:hypothetical protein
MGSAMGAAELENKMTLREQGFRYLANPSTGAIKWVHPAEAATTEYAGHTDCTDMDDEFTDFVLLLELI